VGEKEGEGTWVGQGVVGAARIEKVRGARIGKGGRGGKV